MNSTSEDTTRIDLRDRLRSFIRGEHDEGSFERFALDLFAWQFEHCAPYRALCQSRGLKRARSVVSLDAIPLAPTEAFKAYRMACFGSAPGEIRFETSGTSQGRPGVHYLRDTSLYDEGAMRSFSRALLPDGPRLRFFSLTAPPSGMPHSSLVHMIETAGRCFGLDARVDYFFSDQKLDVDLFASSLREASARGEPVLLLTTSFALVHLIEAAHARGMRFPLPPGSRVMETGGYKGRSRELSRDELYHRAVDCLEVPPRLVINEYGMTEMSSQFYDRTNIDGALDPVERRVKAVPPWVRSFVLDPRTLRPAKPGEPGVLGHIDLANLDSCAFLLTGDAAFATENGFVLLGRLDEAGARGCSLDYEPATR